MKKLLTKLKKILVILVILANLAGPGSGQLPIFAQEATDSAQAESSPTETPIVSPTQGRSPSTIPTLTPTITPVLTSPEPTAIPTVIPTTSPTIPEPSPTLLNITNTPSSAESATIRQPITLRPLFKKHYQVNEEVEARLLNAQDLNVSITVVDRDSRPISTEIRKDSLGDQMIIKFKSPPNLKPGRYSLRVTDPTGRVEKQDFTWGVLAINTNKSIYTPNETAKLSLAVLDEQGKMICDAKLTLQIISEKAGVFDTLSTKDKTIITNPDCQGHSFSPRADYEASYQLKGEGNYHLELSAETKTSQYLVTDVFEVRETVPFDIEREMATRVYPPEDYPVNLIITANQDFEGTVTETVPDSFDIKPAEDKTLKSYDEVKTEVIRSGGLVLGIASQSLKPPFDGSYPISQSFGEIPTNEKLKKSLRDQNLIGHDGVDFDMPEGTPIFAVDDGEVKLAGKGLYGVTVILSHSWGESYYGHLSQPLVEVGQKIAKGDKIALSGNTGVTTGPHLHFSVKPDQNDPTNGYFGKVDPLPYLALAVDKNVLGAMATNVYLKKIIWNISLKKGEELKLGYTFQLPKLSPQIYLIGPLTFVGKDNKNIFSEARQWQIAADEIDQAQLTSEIPTVEERQRFEEAMRRGRIGRKQPPIDLDLKNVASDSGESHNFSMKYPWNGMKVMFGDKKEGSLGYKVVSGDDPVYWFELKMKELDRFLFFRDLIKGRTPQVKKRQATYTIGDQVEVKYEIKDNYRVKAEYIVNKPLPSGDLEFALDYPEEEIVPVETEKGEIEFAGNDGDGKSSGHIAFRMEKPTASDANGKEVPVSLKLSGKNVVLSVRPGSDAVYPITIDPTAVDATAIAAATAYGSQTHLLKDFNGSLIAVYMTTGSDLEAEWSNDSGATWSSSGPVVATTITSVGAAIDSLGNIHAVTAESGIKYRKLTITRSGTSISSASWTATAVGLDTASISVRPSVIVDTGNDLPAAVWTTRPTGGTKKGRVRFMRAKTISTTPDIADWCNDDASTCGTAASTSYCTITPGTTNVCADGSSLAISATNAASNDIIPVLQEMPSTGTFVVWWSDSNVSDLYRIYGARSTDATSGKPSYKWAFTTTGTQYTESTDLSTNTTTGFNLAAASDTVNNRLVLTYSDTTNHYTAVKYRTSAMAESDSSTDISPTTTNWGTDASLSAGSLNGAQSYLMTYKTSAGYIALRSYNTSTTSWSGETILDQSSANLTYSSLRLDAKSHTADQTSTTTTSSSAFGRADSTYVKLAECFTAGQTAKISQVALNLVKNSSPVDGVVVELLNYDSGTSKPGSTVSASGGVAAANLGSAAWVYVPLNTSVSLTSGTKYCLGVRRLATADNTNNYSWSRGTTSTLANADGYYYDASGWSSAQSWDFAFTSYYESTADADKPKFDVLYTDSSAADVFYHTWHINETYSRTKDATPVALPSNANDLVVFADQADYDNMATDDTNYVTITGSASSSNYNIFLYKKRNISGTTIDTVTATVVARSSVNCSATNATVYLKIYNSTNGTWDDFDSAQSNNTCTANNDFTFTATKTVAAGYYDSNKYVAIRMYQDAGEGSAYNLTTDRVNIAFSTPSAAPVVQRSYRFEDDDGPNPNQNTAVAAADTDVTSVKKGERFLARFQIDTGAFTTQYELQFGSTAATGDACSTASGWTAVTTSSAIAQSWAISGNYRDMITSSKAAANGNTRHDGYFIEQTPNITANYLTPKYILPASSYTEHVFAISTANATVNTKYCLRLKDYTNGLPLTYTGNKYPALTIVDSTNDTIRYSKGAPTSLATDTSVLNHPLDDKGYTDITSENSVRDTTKASLLKSIPPTTTFENPTATNSENFGFSVASAGDVNGDGYSDVIVGAYGYTTSRGQAYIFFGNSSMTTPDSGADVTLENPTATNNERFGISVASAGDVNGDGYSDVVVGASGYPSNNNRGRAYIYKGSSGITGTISVADVTLENPTGNNSEYFSYSAVASAGDVNGDGYSDVVVGAYVYSTSRGRAYIFKGSSGITGTITSADVTLENPTSTNGENFGRSVSSTGDVNGDGYSDVVVGAPAYPSNNNRGRAYIFKGSSGITGTISVADVTLENPTSTNWESFGTSASSAGDVNGDGYSDVIVGASGYPYDGAVRNRGRAYIFKGSSGITGTITNADVILENPTVTNNEDFGYSVSSAGDVNGDGYSDVIVGAYGYPSNNDRGRAYIFKGSSGITGTISTADVTLENPTSTNTENFGYSVASAGDVNGDGYSDVIVGAYGYTSSRGRAYAFYGGFGTLDNPTATNSEEFGYSVSSAGDVNGDGYSDVIVGADRYPNNNYRGRAYIYFGKKSGVSGNTPDVTLENPTGNNSEYFGYSVAGGGDINGDGYSDLVVGAYGYTTNRGRAYIFKGSSGMTGTISVADVTLENPTATNSEYFGNSVAGAGDVNGDGYSDLIVGASQYTSSRGRAYIYKGSSGMTGTISVADVTLENPTATNGENFGDSVAGAGDVNGDGYSDLIVGAYGYTTNRGRAYIFKGSASISGTITVADVTLENPTATNSEYFGDSVAGAGDVNGDGYSDLVVGAYQYPSNNYRGRAYIFKGSSGITGTISTADVTLENPTATNGENFGWSVAGAGDVNGDGYSDLVVGTYGYTTNRGRAYIFKGSASISGTITVADVTLENPTATNSEYFGNSVAGAGDVNGDGYSDVVVAAYAYPYDGTIRYRGRAYDFFGGSSTTTSLPEFLFSTKNSNATDDISFSWNGSSSQVSYSQLDSSAVNTLKLKIEAYDQSSTCDATTGWRTVSNQAAVKNVNVEFTIARSITSCPADYYDGDNRVYFRISQTSTTGHLRTDLVSITFSAAAAGGPTLDQLMRHGDWFNNSGVRQPFTF